MALQRCGNRTRLNHYRFFVLLCAVAHTKNRIVRAACIAAHVRIGVISIWYLRVLIDIIITVVAPSKNRTTTSVWSDNDHMHEAVKHRLCY